MKKSLKTLFNLFQLALEKFTVGMGAFPMNLFDFEEYIISVRHIFDTADRI